MLTPRKSNAGETRQASMTDSVSSFFQTSIISPEYLRDSRLWVSSSTSLFSLLPTEFPLVKQAQAEIRVQMDICTLPEGLTCLLGEQPLFGKLSPKVCTWQHTNVKMNANGACALRHFAFTWGLQDHMFYCKCSLWEFFRKVLHVWDSQHVQVSPI